MALLDINGDGAREMAAEAGGGAIGLTCDVTKAADVDHALAATVKAFGRIDVVINNAGWTHRNKPLLEVTEEEFDRIYAVNVKAPFILVAELAPAMAARGKGAVVNVLTMVAHFGIAGMGLYGSSKAALTLLTKAWAAEFGPSGVRVNAVSPGPTRTEGTEAMGSQLDVLASMAPAGRPAAPDEIASAIGYLAGDEASFVHGAVLDVDGGRNAA